MPKSKSAAQHDQRIIEKERERNAGRQRTESVAEIGREEKEQTATGQKAALDGTLRTGSLPVRAKARDQFSAKHRGGFEFWSDRMSRVGPRVCRLSAGGRRIRTHGLTLRRAALCKTRHSDTESFGRRERHHLGGPKVRTRFACGGIFMMGACVRSPIRGRRRVHQPRNRGPAPAGARNARSNRPTWLPGGRTRRPGADGFRR
jgi:hypothetical protein